MASGSIACSPRGSLALSRSRLKALILGGQVAVAARTIRDPNTPVKSGDNVTVALPAPEPAKPAGEAIPLNVVYEDDALIVIDKPTGSSCIRPPATPRARWSMR